MRRSGEAGWGAVVFVLTLLLVGCRTSTPKPSADAGADRIVDVGSSIEVSTLGTWSLDGVELSPDQPVDFGEPGRFRLVHEVAGGDPARDDAIVTVVPEPLDDRPVTAGPLAAVGEALLAVAMPDFGTVAVVDLASRTTVAHVEACDEPVSLAAVSDDEIAVACADDEIVVVSGLDTSAPEVTDRHALAHGDRPTNVLASTTHESVWVTLAGEGAVLVLDLATGRWRELARVPDPEGMARVESNLVVTRFRSVDGVGLWYSVPLDATGAVAHVLEADPGPDSDTGSRGVPNLLASPAVSPDGATVAIPVTLANTFRGEFRDGSPLTHETMLRSSLRITDTSDGLGRGAAEASPITFDNRGRAAVAAFSAFGDALYVVQDGLGIVDVVDVFSHDTLVSHQNLGLGLSGLHVQDQDTLWVLSSLTREIVVIDDVASPDGEVTRIDLLPSSGEVRDAAELAGERLFNSADARLSRDGYVACASCHPAGEHDGLTWDFTDRGEGLRNTPSLAGRMRGPLHWSGNFDELQDFEGDIRRFFGGTGLLSDEDWATTADPMGSPKAGLSVDLDALAAYVASLNSAPRSPHREDDGSMTDGALRGLELFESSSVGCAACHSGSSYTDSRLEGGAPVLHDVGTITDASGGRAGGPLLGIDAPSLLALWATAPYLHDGSQRSLEDVISSGHGMPSRPLSEDEVLDLVRFLEQLE